MAIHIRKVREEMGLITDGEIRKSDGTAKRVIMEHSKGSVEIIIVNGTKCTALIMIKLFIQKTDLH